MATTLLQCSALGARCHRSAQLLGRAPSRLPSLRCQGPLRRTRPQSRETVAVRAQMDTAVEEAVSYAALQAADSLPSFLDNLSAHLTTQLFLLADAVPPGLGELTEGAQAPLPDGSAPLPDVDPAAVADAVADEAAKNGGFFGFFADAFEAFLKVLDSGFETVGVPYSYGFAIIFLTLLVKIGTYPLTKKQVESTMALQSLQPRVKELQAKYANDAERLQVETAKLYQTAGVNPLAGCLPTLVTIPVFIGLYKALSNVADEGLLTEGFFWIPSLAGPTKLNGGLSWLSLSGGAPPLGWGETAQYLILPVLLVISQYISQKIISPPQNKDDPQQAQANAILKFMPFMIGWFSLNVPSGLTLYWFANNIITTAQQAYLRSKFQAPALATSGAPIGTIVKPKDEEEEDKRPTGKELNARRSPKQLDAPSSSGAAAAAASGRSGEKFRAIKAREAAKKAASEAAQAGSGEAAGASAAAAPAAPAPGSKFAEIKAREEAAKKAAPAPAAEGQASSSNGSSAAAVAAEAAPASVAVVEPEVIEPAERSVAQHAEQEQQGEQVIAEVHAVAPEAAEEEAPAAPAPVEAATPAAAPAPGPKAAGGKKGGKKGSRRK